MSEEELDAIRRDIDKIDREIIQLLNRRMEVALKARGFKKKVLDPKREQEIIDNVRRFSRKPLRPDFSESLYRQILEESRHIQGKILDTSEGKIAEEV